MKLLSFFCAFWSLVFFVACSDDDSDFVSRPDAKESSSNTTAKSSSSVTRSAVDPSTVVVGEMTDSRDGQTYKTVKIGDQTWMAENLNFKVDSSFCYDNVDSNCIKYGRLYVWSVVMDSVGKWSTDGKGCGLEKPCSPTYPVRGICPEDWHLPSNDEWNTLFSSVGGAGIAGKKLKSDVGWDDYLERNGNGTDDYSFTVLPAGIRGSLGGYGEENSKVYFWSSTEDHLRAYEVMLCNSGDTVLLYSLFKYNGHYVRCLKDEPSRNLSSSSVVRGTVDPSTVVMGEMTDERDGQTYKTVKIGDQTWMAENLNYAYLQPIKTLDSSSFCYDNNPSYCEKYGRLYLWSSAMDSIGTWSTNGKDCGYDVPCSPTYPVRGVCPEDWHLPSQDEWKVLFSAVGNEDVAGKMLKSANGWFSSRDGLDDYSFAILPAGVWGRGVYGEEGGSAYFWSSTMISYGAAISMLFYYGYEGVLVTNLYKKPYRLSVRCVKD